VSTPGAGIMGFPSLSSSISETPPAPFLGAGERYRSLPPSPLPPTSPDTEPPKAQRPTVLVTVPVRNEAPRLAASIWELKRALDGAGFAYHLAVAEDGSTDGTHEILQSLAKEIPELIVQRNRHALGRGKALRMLWSQIPADVYCFTDADLAAGAESVVHAISRVISGEPIVVGSRYAPGAKLSRPPLRSFVSRAYNSLIRQAFREKIQDHQCGLKAFAARTLDRILPLSCEDSWFWDTEILVLASHSGIPIAEMPVAWTETKTHRTSVGRLLSDIYLHGKGILRLLARLEKYRSSGPTASMLGSPKKAPSQTRG